MGDQGVRERLKGRELRFFTIFSLLMLFGAGLYGMEQEGQRIGDVLRGLWIIVISRDALITDYFELAGYGTAFLNAVIVMSMGLALLRREKARYTGLTMAAVFINVGYALWGKNPVNILPILLGASVYARTHGFRMSKYLYTTLFGTSLAPLVTELIFLLPFNRWINLLIAIGAGTLIGFIGMRPWLWRKAVPGERDPFWQRR